MDAVYPNFTSDLFILEISSTEFSSEFRLSGEQRIIVFDHEQVNSLNWFVNLNLKIEHPIFHYNEFMIRSGELLASWGEIQAAKRIHERIEEAWRSYNSAITTPYPYWRPFYPDGLKSVSRVVDYLAHSFVLGHEIGHHFQTLEPNDDIILAKTIADAYHADAMFEPSQSGSGPKFASFFRPPIDVKLNEDGVFDGQATRGRFLIGSLDQINEQQKSELFCDYFAFLAISLNSASRSVPHSDVIRSLVLCIEGLEKLTYLTKTMLRTPRLTRRCAVRFDDGHGKLRIGFLLYLMEMSRTSNPKVPATLHDYWSKITPESAKLIEMYKSQYGLNSIADMTTFLARGAFCLGIGMPFPDLPAKPESGSEGVLEMASEAFLIPWRFPSNIYEISRNNGWNPDQRGDPSMIGFASAVANAVSCVFGHGLEFRNNRKEKEAAVWLVRSPRARLLNPSERGVDRRNGRKQRDATRR